MTARALNPWQVATVMIGSLAALVIIASFLFPGRPGPTHVPMQQQAVDPSEPPVHKLPDGTQVSLVAVNDNGAQRSWTPTGRQLQKWVAPADGPGDPVKREQNRDNWRSFIVRIKPAGKGDNVPSVALRFGETRVWPALVYWNEEWTRNRWLGAIYRRFPSATQTISLSYGVATEPWRTVGSVETDSLTAEGLPFHPIIRAEPPVQGDLAKPEPLLSVKVQIPAKVSLDAYTIVVLDRKGKERTPSGGVWVKDSTVQTEYWFVARKEDVDRVELRTRPYHWFEVHNVRVHPPD